jgi:hypothetical protein
MYKQQQFKKFKEAKELRFTKAMERKAYRDTLTPEAQLARLDARLGVGQGATKERKRLQAEIERRLAESVKSKEPAKSKKEPAKPKGK